MSYMRILPRDAFNEANFLKCLAKLTMDIEDGLLPFLTMSMTIKPLTSIKILMAVYTSKICSSFTKALKYI